MRSVSKVQAGPRVAGVLRLLEARSGVRVRPMSGSTGSDKAVCDGYEWRGNVPWKCRLPLGHKDSCKGNEPEQVFTKEEAQKKLDKALADKAEVERILDAYGGSFGLDQEISMWTYLLTGKTNDTC